MNEDSNPWMDLLREIFGDDAEAAYEQMRAMGMDPEALASVAGVQATPGMMDHLLQQIRAMVASSEGEEVNWTLAQEVARGVATTEGDPMVSAAAAEATRNAISRAELWLDAVTDFSPATEQPAVWRRSQWVEATLPAWKVLAGPVALSVARALSEALEREAGEGGLGDLIGHVTPTVCGIHVGQAAGHMGREAFGVTDLGVPLITPARVALVPAAIDDFAAGLDIDHDDVRTYLALREAAHVRLLRNTPWLAGQLHVEIGRFAAGLTIDLAAIDEAVAHADATHPEKLQEALTRGIFTPERSPAQADILARIETTLALIEGWVDDVVQRAAAAHLPSLPALQEMMRRRRAAGGPAEDTFAALLGLELRPRHLRAAAALWAKLTAAGGQSARDGAWAHPDILPTATDLDDPQSWIDRLLGTHEPDDVDRELTKLLNEDE